MEMINDDDVNDDDDDVAKMVLHPRFCVSLPHCTAQMFFRILI